jgi:hypothetical protein
MRQDPGRQSPGQGAEDPPTQEEQAAGGSGYTLPKATSADLHLNCSLLKNKD